ncbi:MAG: TonB-dependent receptor plug domain-containing protein [Calditrichae bacterium]|nr:TonB-dependent receptor plug domain-containing protein [Calditrichia bacterium]
MKNQHLFFVVLLMIFPALIFAASGKLSGVVTDASTGDPLIGVNIVIEGTTLGASSDIDGYYVILNIPAGNYNINFNYIGYRSVSVENVRVVPDITKRLDMGMEETTLEFGEQIVVIAEKPFFEVSATNTVRVLDSDEIERIPVKGVSSIVSANAGVIAADGSGGDTDNATVNVRGGRGNETLFIVDGIPLNDVLLGNAAGTIPDAAIEQISSQIGGFSAKYGSAQSGVINITTKSGATRFFGSVDYITSNITDEFNYNSISGSFGGPLVSKKLSFFLSGEYLVTEDQRPRWSGAVVPTANIDQKTRPDMGSDLYRFTGKVDATFNNFKVSLSGNGSYRDGRGFIFSYMKNNSEHNTQREEDITGGSLRFSHIINQTSFWDLTLRGRYSVWHEGDGVWFKNIEAYGDSTANAAIGVTLPLGDGTRVGGDDVGVFFEHGRVSNRYTKYQIMTGGADFNFTKQFRNHLIELGAMYEQHQLRYYRISPVAIARGDTREEGYNSSIYVFYGYDLFGTEISDSRFRTVGSDRFEEAAPKRPTLAGFYLQDKVEFLDFILNLGVRWDYFNPDHFRFRDPKDIYRFGPRPTRLDEEDLEDMPTENYFSPRIGFAYPVTERTVFHAQYGIFRQVPRFFDIYDSWNNLQIMEQRDGQGQNSGHIEMEKTTQYEFGFKQQIGTLASLDITAYYKNVAGLVNVRTLRTFFGGTTRNYISKINQDFGTVKGLAFSFNLRRLGPVSTRVDYTLALSEGTGSDPSSSRNATFRNPNNEIPLAIAPLDFDQRHTGTVSMDIRGGKNEGPRFLGTKWFSEAGANFLITFNSGRPYTPVVSQNPLPGVDQSIFGSETSQYVNSAYIQGVLRFDVRLDKRFHVGKFALTPYLWIQNLFNSENVIDVWRSTGQPDYSAWIKTPEGEQRLRVEESKGNGEAFLSDLEAVERDPANYGIPRLIRLGIKMHF